MSGKIRRIDYYPDEYISGVGGVLRAEEQGVYWMVCSLIMSEGGAVDYNLRRLAGLCMLRPSHVQRIVGRLVELGKLTLDDGQLCQKRAQSEIDKAASRIQSARESATKRWSSGDETSPKCARSGDETSPKRRTSSEKSEQNQRNADAKASSRGNANHQPATTISSSLRSDDTRPAAVSPRKPCGQAELETVLDPERAEAVVAHRRKIGSGLTTSSASRLAKKLAEWPDPNEAADEMLAAGWRGFEACWLHERRTARGHGPPSGNGATKAQRWGNATDELFDELDRRIEGQAKGAMPSIAGPGRGH